MKRIENTIYVKYLACGKQSINSMKVLMTMGAEEKVGEGEEKEKKGKEEEEKVEGRR